MKQKRYTEEQIIGFLKAHEAGAKVGDLVREHGFSEQSFYRWKSKYGGMEVSDIRRLKELEEENGRLKRMFADLSLKHEALKDIVEKKL